MFENGKAAVEYDGKPNQLTQLALIREVISNLEGYLPPKDVKPSKVHVVSWVMDRDPDTPSLSVHASQEGALKFLTKHLSEYSQCEKAQELLANGKIYKAVDAHNDWIFHGRDGWVYDLDSREIEP